MTTIDERAALVALDLQNGIVALPEPVAASAAVANAARLIDGAEAAGVPVVLVTVAGVSPGRTDRGRTGGTPPADWAELTPVIAARGHHERVTKTSWGAFHGTGLDQRLRELGVTQVLLCGISTSAAVESTARDAYGRGLNVAVVVDATADSDPVAAANSIERVFPRIAETGSTDDVLALLRARS